MPKKRKSKHRKDLWFGAEGEENGKPLVIRGRQCLPTGVIESTYPTRVSIYWSYEPENQSGMPDEKTTDTQHELENALDVLDTPECSCLMLVILGNGRKEWHWYVADVGEWKDKLNEVLAEFPVFPIRIEKCLESGWALYHDFISTLDGI